MKPFGYAGSPPIPPLPPDLRHELAQARYSTATPLAAPRPQRVDPQIGQSLEMYSNMPAPGGPPGQYGTGGNEWSAWNVPPQRQTAYQQTPAPMTVGQQSSPPAQASSASNSLTAELPKISVLKEAMPSIQQPHFDPQLKITWARDVLFLADRAHHLHVTLTTAGAAPSLTDPIIGPMPLGSLDPDLALMVEVAVPMVLAVASPFPPGQAHSSATSSTMEPWQAEAIYMRALFSSTGAFPAHAQHNPKSAFRDFETAARGGYAGAWFRLGRDYETFGDLKHARECFERGARLGVESCLYRIAMAHLLGQLNLTPSTPTALPILHRAAVLSSLECPQPAYVYALLLLGEFNSVRVDSSEFAGLRALAAYPPVSGQPSDPLIPYNSSPHLESRTHLECSAYLHYPPAQYKLGHAYEFADPPFFFDPLLSVQYYSLASQNGEVEADMALSKWFLCGSTGGAPLPAASAPGDIGHFDKDEGLALTFAKKASTRGLASGHFAMGYYAEVGIGQPKDIGQAMHYYELAAAQGNDDARGRLSALQTSDRQAQLDTTEHQKRLERSRTQALRRAEEEAVSPPYEGRTFPRMKDAASSPYDHNFPRRDTLAPPGYQQQVPHSASLATPGNYGPPANKFANAPHSAGVGGFNRPPPPASNQRYGGSPSPPPPQGMAGYRPNTNQVIDGVRKNSISSSFVPLSSAAQNLANAPPPPGAGGYPQQGGPYIQAPQPYAAHPPPPLHQQHQQHYPQQQRPQSGGPRPQSGGSRPGPGSRPTSAHSQGYGGGRQSQSPGRQQQQQQQQQNLHAAYGGGGGPSPAPSPYSQPTTPTNQTFGAGRQGKLTVGVDGPGGGGAPPMPAFPGGTANPNTAGLGTATTAMGPNGKKHPATFAEMGIQGAKAEDKECVIM